MIPDETSSGVAVVLCALGLEYREVRKRLTDVHPRTHAAGTRFEIGTLPESRWAVAIGLTGEGNSSSAAIAERAISTFKPSLLLFVGIAGSLRDEIEIGDVVVATRVYAYQGGKASEEYLSRPVTWPANHRLEQLAQHLAMSEGWKASLREQGADVPNFTVHLKPIAAGESVVASRDSQVAQYLLSHYNDAVAVEMEGAGLAHAAHLNDQLPALVIRGISDHANATKAVNDKAGWQNRAAKNASAFASELLANIEPRDIEARRPEQHTSSSVLAGSSGMPPRGKTSQRPASTSSNMLPRDTFVTGRNTEIDYILSQFQSNGVTSSLIIDAVDGMAGVGKTTLALHVAHRMKVDYPDAQLYIDLHGYTPGMQPVEPGEALGMLLRMLDVPDEKIPISLDERAALWRSQLAARRAVIVLDNVRRHDQVRPLLPGATSSRVIITSRRKLTGLDDVRSVSLECFDEKSALELLTRLAGDARVQAQQGQARQLVSLCGYLPLAVQLAGNYLRHRPAHPIQSLVSSLTDEHKRLGILRAENLGVSAAFEVSYSALTQSEQVMFRRIGLHEGAGFTAAAAAAIASTPDGDAEDLLMSLYEQGLIREFSTGRFQMHDLVRDYARDLVRRIDSETDRNRCIERILEYYTDGSYFANQLIDPSAWLGRELAPARGLPFSDRQSAVEWMDAERLNILAAAHQADQLGWHLQVCFIAAATAPYLHVRGYTESALEIHQRALRASQEVSDPQMQALAHENIGDAHWEAGSFRDATRNFEAGLDLANARNDLAAEARLLDKIGFTFERTGQYDLALERLQRSLALWESLNNPHGRAKTLNSVGAVLWRQGNYEGALEHFDSALAIRTQIGDKNGQVRTLNNIGFTLERTGDLNGALQRLLEALDLSQQLSDRHVESTVQNNLGYTYVKIGNPNAAIRYSEQGLSLSIEVQSAYEEGRAHDGLGRAYALIGDAAQALAHFARALHIFEHMEVPERFDIAERISAIEQARQSE